MSKKNKLLIILLIFSLIASSCTKIQHKYTISPNEISIHFINVGQGDSILIKTTNKTILIDAGPNESEKKLIKYLKKENIKKLDYLIATHPHEDHIGGMDKIVRKFKIGAVYAPDITADTETFKDFTAALKIKKIKINKGKSGTNLNIDENVKCFIIAPNGTYYKNTNNYSLVIKLIYKNNSFLFLGDAENEIESEILNSSYNVNSSVIKIAHHGSSSSSSINFLEKVNPKIAIISCGKVNDFGHPHKETIVNLLKINCKIYKTGFSGNIVLISDGYKIKKCKD